MAGLRVVHCAMVAVWVSVVPLMHAQQTQTSAQGNAAQQVSPTPTGEVTGTVLAADTQKPVRFAQITLQSTESASGGGNDAGSLRGRLLQRGQTRNLTGATDPDGTFTLTNVAPGDYYVTASAPGFLAERSVLLTALNDGADPAQLLAGIPVAHVAAYSSSNVVLTVQRGGALSGRVAWEDGSGAAGVFVMALSATQKSTVLPPPLQGLQLNGISQFATTDDRGDFRIAGLPSGDYLVQTTIENGARFGGQAGSYVRREPARVGLYAPGVFRKGEAKSYSVRTGEERTDVRLTVDLRGVHTFTGHVGSTDANQTVASGRVSLTDAADPSLQLSGIVDGEGDFTVRYVPPGNYLLQVIGASTMVPGGRGRGDAVPNTPVVTFQPFSQPVVVRDTDLTGFAATLTPAQTTAH